jgi:hypothetical protein
MRLVVSRFVFLQGLFGGASHGLALHLRALLRGVGLRIVMALGLRRHNREWRNQQRHDDGEGYAFEHVRNYPSLQQ